MPKKMKLIMDTVKWILENEVEARNDDDLLVLLVETHFNPKIAELSYTEVRRNHYKYFKYSEESIRRCRRRVQAMYPELKADEPIYRKRKRLEEEYRKWAKGDDSGRTENVC